MRVSRGDLAFQARLGGRRKAAVARFQQDDRKAAGLKFTGQRDSGRPGPGNTDVAIQRPAVDDIAAVHNHCA
jgi:hypothetical protein